MTVTKVAAGALASVTAAVAGSKLGVAGTITGAALVSIVSTVGTALYQHSLERTKDRVRTHAITVRQAAISEEQQALLRRHWPTRPDEPTQRIRPVPTDHPSTTAQHPTPPAAQPADAQLTAAMAPPSDRPTTNRTSTSRTVRWALLAAGAVVVFLAGLLGVTSIELVTGQAIAGGPNGSTTLGLATHGQHANDRKPGQPDQPGTVPTERSATPVPTRDPATTSPTARTPTTQVPTPTGTPQPTVGDTPTGTPAPTSTGASTSSQPTNQQPAPSVPVPTNRSN